ncbi:hypothetical protein BDB00DRAFT_929947 [Zychaea mexicana]|uniref:uncharacterized protein n=1 Tax=Zychaea mexicana TaxID=64656 RepID=UPI0022FF1220|nr:uncharacterized protein BDB00DRAFT_929947 [Zychaea mexicana]KAI9492039.1 hypothetical protein BDB00DRAFT_929947 [Zychaea mexicana]
MASPSSIPVKPDPDAQQDQDDLLMSYLNADCLAAPTDSNWNVDDPPSPPYSTSSSSDNASQHAHQSMDMAFDTTAQQQQQVQVPPPPPPQLFNAFGTTWLPHPSFLPAAPLEFFQSFVPPAYLQQQQQQQQQQPLVDSSTRSSYSSSSSLSSSSSDNEQPKKKRGRKKRVDSQPPASIAPAPLRPLAARVNKNIKPNPATTEPVATAPPSVTPSTPQQQQQPSSSPSSPPPPSQPTTQQKQQSQPVAIKVEPQENSQDSQKAAAIAKRQERLIKNRAAALLSRKRKREHLNALEEEKQALSVENDQLKTKVAALEAQVDTLEKENHDLWRRLGNNMHSPATTALQSHNNNKLNNRATGVVFMIILFSFALFSLPARTVNQLTVGGHAGPLSLDGAYIQQQQQRQEVLERATLDAAPKQGPQQGKAAEAKTTDLVLMDPVRPQTLQTWIKDRLSRTSNEENEEMMATGDLVRWSQKTSAASAGSASSPATAAAPQIYLYSSEFSQVAPIPQNNDTSTSAAAAAAVNMDTTDDDDDDLSDRLSGIQYQQQQYQYNPVLSFISPLYHDADQETVAMMTNETTHQQQQQKYLQIDVQVLGSRVIDGQLLSLDQCPFATSLLHTIKDDLLNPVTHGAAAAATNDGSTVASNDDGALAGRSTTNDRRVKKDMRRKLVGEKRRISRVAV